MSEKTPRSAAADKAAAALVNQYKPVGIAALTAATLCRSNKGKPKK